MYLFLFFFNDTATTEIYTLSLHDALPILRRAALRQLVAGGPLAESVHIVLVTVVAAVVWNSQPVGLTLGWVGAVAAAAGLRSWWRLRATKRVLSAEEALRGVRLTVAGVGLAWG